MFLSFDETAKIISSGKLLHIAGTENLLKKLPKGNWVGGSTEYFISSEGGKVSNDHLSVTEFPYGTFSIKTYSVSDISKVVSDTYDNGFSVLIIPFDSPVHKEYAQKASEYEDIFMKNIVGWITGMNLNTSGQTPISVDGNSGAVYSDKAVAVHVKVPDDKSVVVNIVNIFDQDESTPAITFKEEGFSVKKCFIDGKETDFADYIAKSGIDTKLPLVGDYGGQGVNVSFKAVENGTVNFYAPVFKDIQYHIAKKIPNYEKEFNGKISSVDGSGTAFSCNCILNFLYGELEGKKLDFFVGPVTFGEIAYQLVNQTLVYVQVM